MGQFSLIWLTARRMLLRGGDAGRGRSFWVLWICLGLTAAACAIVWFDIGLGVGADRMVAVPLVGGAAALLALGLLCVRILTPVVAVAVFGMALGCAALMTVFAVTSGFEVELTRRVSSLNGHVLVTKYGLGFTEYESMIADIESRKGVVAAVPFAYAMASMVPVEPEPPEDAAPVTHDSGDKPPRRPAVVVGKGMDPERAKLLEGVRQSMASGTLDALRPANPQLLPGVALGVDLARRLAVSPGDHVRMVLPADLDGTEKTANKPPRFAEFEVLDLVETGMVDLDRSLALVHLRSGQALFFGGRQRVTGIEVTLDDPGMAQEFADTLLSTLDRRLFHAITWQQQSSTTLAGLRQIRLGVSVVLGLLELVAATALVASLLLLVRRKRVEIAGMMSLGADGRLIFWIFEAVGLVAGGAGAIVGLCLGGLFCGLVAGFHFPLQGDVYPIAHLPVELGLIDALGPALAAIVLCAMV
ncbi:MAG: ABC transporter permease, partial [Nannocystaceae bacterium]